MVIGQIYFEMGLDDANPVEPIQIGEIKVDKQGKTNQIRNQCANLLGVFSQECKIYCRCNFRFSVCHKKILLPSMR